MDPLAPVCASGNFRAAHNFSEAVQYPLIIRDGVSMAKVSGIVAAFRAYKAKLANQNWAVSSVIDGAVVMSLWKHRFQGPGLLYVDRLSRWKGPGNNLFRQHLTLALQERLPVLLVMSTSSDPAAVDRGEDASKLHNTFSVRPDLVGTVEFISGDDFAIRFVEATPKTN